MKKLTWVVAVFILMIGCSSGNSELQEIKASDLCVTHINLKEKICYGDERKKVEKITGLSIDPEPYSSTGYENGVSIMYRDDKVVAIRLDDESLGIYEIKYAKLGETKTNVIERLGSENAYANAPRNLDYFYDSQTKKFMS